MPRYSVLESMLPADVKLRFTSSVITVSTPWPARVSNLVGARARCTHDDKEGRPHRQRLVSRAGEIDPAPDQGRDDFHTPAHYSLSLQSSGLAGPALERDVEGEGQQPVQMSHFHLASGRQDSGLSTAPIMTPSATKRAYLDIALDEVAQVCLCLLRLCQLLWRQTHFPA